jgi:enterochelin esterase-like enzyme
MPIRLHNWVRAALSGLLALVGWGRAPTPAPTLPPPTPTRLPTGGVQIEVIRPFTSTLLNNTRTLAVFLPDDYDSKQSDGDARYPVLYANDGQDMTAVHLKKTLERLYRQNAIEKIIVVAVYAAEDRLQEYGVAGTPDYKGRGSRAGLYSRFLLEEVMPYIHDHYRTRTGHENTSVMGWSLGGLMAFDLAWQNPDVFGAVGVFSGSFWWRDADGDVSVLQSARLMHRLVREGRYHADLRMWFEAGTHDETDDRDNNGVINAIQDTTELMDELRSKGYVDGEDMLYVQVEGGQHNPATWGQALPEFLKWVFPVDGHQ